MLFINNFLGNKFRRAAWIEQATSWTVKGSNPGWINRFFFPPKIPTGSGAPLGAKATGGAILNISHLVEKEWSYTSAPLIRLHVVDNFTLLVLR